MKIKSKILIGFIFTLIILMLLIVRLTKWLSSESVPEGSILLADIVSYCTGDVDGDGTAKLLAIIGDGEIDSGERHGEFLLVCDASAEIDMNKLGYILPEKIIYQIDLSSIKPLKVQVGDINGDEINEIAICVYKTAEFHPIMAKRPFFYDLVEGNLIPIWLGSRLSKPFDDYILYDIDEDSIEEIISIEQLENGNRVVAIYNWRGFGFEMLTQSEDFETKLFFDLSSMEVEIDAKEIGIQYFDGEETIALKFYLEQGNLLYK